VPDSAAEDEGFGELGPDLESVEDARGAVEDGGGADYDAVRGRGRGG
jgi:hypothetical protein